VTLASGVAGPAAGQDLEPRAYSASPVNTTFVVAGISRSSGTVLTDPSLPIEDVNARIGILTAGVGHTFGLFGRTALVTGLLPYARAGVSGRTGETMREVTRVGWADARARFSVNLIGGAALRLPEFAAARRSTIAGVSLSVVAPTGQYVSSRLINLGSNRWSVKPEVGLSVPLGRWHLDAYAGLWLFTPNDAFYPGSVRREQDPVAAIQGHVSYTIRPRLWAAFDATWYTGGTTSLDGASQDDLQRNSRLGLTVSVPLGARQALKAAYNTGVATRTGGDFDTLTLAWQMSWTR
jgi:hypothetical protein